MTRDELIDRLAGTMHQVVDSMWVGDRPTPPIEALMEHVDAYVQAEHERIVQAIEQRTPGRSGPNDWNREWSKGLRTGMNRAASIVRSKSAHEGDRGQSLATDVSPEAES